MQKKIVITGFFAGMCFDFCLLHDKQLTTEM